MSDPKPMPPPIPPGPVAVPPGSDKPSSFGPGSFVDLGPGVEVIFVPAARVKGWGDPWRKPEDMWDRMNPNKFWNEGLGTPPEAFAAWRDGLFPPRKPPPAEADAVSQPKPGADAPGLAPDQCGVAECGADLGALDLGIQDLGVEDWGVEAGHDMPTPATDPWW